MPELSASTAIVLRPIAALVHKQTWDLALSEVTKANERIAGLSLDEITLLLKDWNLREARLSSPTFADNPALSPTELAAELAEREAERNKARKIHTEPLRSDDAILSQDVLDVLIDLEHPLPIQPEPNVPHDTGQVVEREVQPEQGQPVTRKGTVFERSDAKLFFEALENPDHIYNLQAETALEGFTKSVEKSRVTTLNKVSSEYHIPIKNLSEWVAKGLIPYESRDKNAIYLSKDIAQEVARDDQEAKEMGVQTARLLRERHEKYFPSVSNK